VFFFEREGSVMAIACTVYLTISVGKNFLVSDQQWLE
jgi:hypothetical protein